jgi:hypothetical protein
LKVGIWVLEPAERMEVFLCHDYRETEGQETPPPPAFAVFETIQKGDFIAIHLKVRDEENTNLRFEVFVATK